MKRSNSPLHLVSLSHSFRLFQVRTSVVAEHLVQELHDVSSMRELTHSLAAAAAASPDGGGSACVAGKMREFEIEMERLASKIEHLKAQNEVLGITLGESKSQCEGLTVLIGERGKISTEEAEITLAVDFLHICLIAGKYESNLIAQQLVAHYADHTIESLELLSQMHEARLDEGDDARLRLDVVEEKAHKLLLKLEEAMRPDSGLALVHHQHRPHEKSKRTTAVAENPCPWEDSSGYSQTTG